MQATITKMGNSCGVRIPKPILELLGMKEKDTIELAVFGGEIILRKPLPKTPAEFWAGCTPRDYDPISIDWGEDVGAEVVGE